MLTETPSLLLSKAAVIAVACIFGLTYSLTATLIALNLAAMGLMWGSGALLGPLLAGLAMQAALHGLPWLIAALCLAFMVLAFRLRA